MPSSAEYKQKAEECLKLSEQAHDEIERAYLLRLVDQWMRLAEHKAKREAGQGR